MFLLILSLVIALIAVLFALSNTETVTITIFGWQLFEGSLALVLLIALAIGVLIAFLAYSPTLIRSKMNLSGQRKKISFLEKTVAEQQSMIDQLQIKLLPQKEEQTPEPANPAPITAPQAPPDDQTPPA